MGSALEILGSEVRHALRSLRRSRGVVVPAVLSLGLGIGGTTALFTGLNAFVLRPPPLLEGLLEVVPAESPGKVPARPTLAALEALREGSPGIALAAYATGGANLAAGAAEYVGTAEVSDGFFDVLRASPLLGRVPEGAGEGAIGEGLWRRRFGARPGIVGAALPLDGRPVTVTGVLPREFNFPASDVEVWVPLRAMDQERPAAIVGRLAAGSARDAAEAAVSAAWRSHVEATAPGAGAASARLEGVHERIVPDKLRRAARIGIAAALMVLLIGCVNVANLLLARTVERRHEMAVRAALGAGRLRLARQLLVESLLLAAAGGALGVLLALAGVRGLELLWASVPDTRPLPEGIEPSASFLLFALAASLSSAVVFGLAPALEAARAAPRPPVSGGARSSTLGRGRAGLQRAFVVAQLALACLLLASSTLLVKSFLGLQDAPLGFRTEGVATFGVTLPRGGSASPRTLVRVAEAVREVPGVRAVGAAAGVPIPLLRGRLIAGTDRLGAPTVAVVNESMARRHWPGGDPLGARIRVDTVAYEVVGVVGDTREWGPHSVGPPMVYASVEQTGATSLRFVARTDSPPAGLAARIRAVVAAVDPDLGIAGPFPMHDLLTGNTARSAVMTRVMAAFAALALLLATLLPARLAASVEPAEALRSE